MTSFPNACTNGQVCESDPKFFKTEEGNAAYCQDMTQKLEQAGGAEFLATDSCPMRAMRLLNAQPDDTPELATSKSDVSTMFREISLLGIERAITRNLMGGEL